MTWVSASISPAHWSPVPLGTEPGPLDCGVGPPALPGPPSPLGTVGPGGGSLGRLPKLRYRSFISSARLLSRGPRPFGAVPPPRGALEPPPGSSTRGPPWPDGRVSPSEVGSVGGTDELPEAASLAARA